MLIDAKTGAVETSFPDFSGAVGGIASAGAKGWYVGGESSEPKGRALIHLGQDGSLDTAFVPNPAISNIGPVLYRDGVVYVGTDVVVAAFDAQSGKRLWITRVSGEGVSDLAYGAGTLYIAGNYARIGGVHRVGIAALNVSNGKPTSWRVRLSSPMGAGAATGSLAFSNGKVYLSGSFDAVDGAKRENGLAAVSARSGRPTAWRPRPGNSYPRYDSNYVVSMLVSHGQVLIGDADSFFDVFDARTGSRLSWTKKLIGNPFSLASSGNTVYLGGYNGAGFSRGQRKPAYNPASVALPSGKLTSWRPQAGRCTSVSAIAVSGGKVLAGGFFSSSPCLGP